jgi:succinate dehydrogenase / fumarate reductase, membrane anchor subunit
VARNMTSFRTPLARIRGLGSARAGTGAFWHQRVSSVALVPLSIAFVWIVVATVGKDYNSVHAMVSSPFVAILIAAFVLAGVYHMQIGMQVILEDYVHHPIVKLAALIANALVSILIALACLYAVLRIGFT